MNSPDNLFPERKPIAQPIGNNVAIPSIKEWLQYFSHQIDKALELSTKRGIANEFFYSKVQGITENVGGKWALIMRFGYELQRTAEMLDILLEKGKQSILVLDKDDNIITYNDKFVSFIQKTLDSICYYPKWIEANEENTFLQCCHSTGLDVLKDNSEQVRSTIEKSSVIDLFDALICDGEIMFDDIAEGEGKIVDLKPYLTQKQIEAEELVDEIKGISSKVLENELRDLFHKEDPASELQEILDRREGELSKVIYLYALDAISDGGITLNELMDHLQSIFDTANEDGVQTHEIKHKSRKYAATIREKYLSEEEKTERQDLQKQELALPVPNIPLYYGEAWKTDTGVKVLIINEDSSNTTVTNVKQTYASFEGLKKSLQKNRSFSTNILRMLGEIELPARMGYDFSFEDYLGLKDILLNSQRQAFFLTLTEKKDITWNTQNYIDTLSGVLLQQVTELVHDINERPNSYIKKIVRTSPSLGGLLKPRKKSQFEIDITGAMNLFHEMGTSIQKIGEEIISMPEVDTLLAGMSNKQEIKDAVQDVVRSIDLSKVVDTKGKMTEEDQWTYDLLYKDSSFSKIEKHIEDKVITAMEHNARFQDIFANIPNSVELQNIIFSLMGVSVRLQHMAPDTDMRLIEQKTNQIKDKTPLEKDLIVLKTFYKERRIDIRNRCINFLEEGGADFQDWGVILNKSIRNKEDIIQCFSEENIDETLREFYLFLQDNKQEYSHRRKYIKTTNEKLYNSIIIPKEIDSSDQIARKLQACTAFDFFALLQGNAYDFASGKQVYMQAPSSEFNRNKNSFQSMGAYRLHNGDALLLFANKEHMTSAQNL